MATPIVSNVIPDTSRLSGSKVEKFLVDGERLLFTTERWLNVSGQQRKAHVTSMRLLFYKQEGRMFGLVKNDRLDEMYVDSIRKLKLEERGLIGKTLILQIDEYNIVGNRNDLLGMYRALQSARARHH
jgi:hypothetical protein